MTFNRFWSNLTFKWIMQQYKRLFVDCFTPKIKIRGRRYLRQVAKEWTRLLRYAMPFFSCWTNAAPTKLQSLFDLKVLSLILQIDEGIAFMLGFIGRAEAETIHRKVIELEMDPWGGILSNVVTFDEEFLSRWFHWFLEKSECPFSMTSSNYYS